MVIQRLDCRALRARKDDVDREADMGSFSLFHWLIVLVVVIVVFGGRGKLSGLMGDAGKGIKAFKDGLSEGDTPKEPETKVIEHKD